MVLAYAWCVDLVDCNADNMSASGLCERNVCIHDPLTYARTNCNAKFILFCFAIKSLKLNKEADTRNALTNTNALSGAAVGETLESISAVHL